ncbi:hypothetical protein PG994_007199 [Apiospora phragmitis]|uniref:Uncharacterized protein n=1 Tax=Apiospora phragmitis TaxID=2905665 RepID=A0ABR1V040_9PEZI
MLPFSVSRLQCGLPSVETAQPAVGLLSVLAVGIRLWRSIARRWPDDDLELRVIVFEAVLFFLLNTATIGDGSSDSSVAQIAC